MLTLHFKFVLKVPAAVVHCVAVLEGFCFNFLTILLFIKDLLEPESNSTLAVWYWFFLCVVKTLAKDTGITCSTLGFLRGLRKDSCILKIESLIHLSKLL